jgi:hypothetical protein
MTLSPRATQRFEIRSPPPDPPLVLAGLKADIRLYLDSPLDEITDDFLPVFDHLWTLLDRGRFRWWRNEKMGPFEALRAKTRSSLRAVLCRGLPRDIGVFEVKGTGTAAVPGGPDDIADVSLSARWYPRAGDLSDAVPAEVRLLEGFEVMMADPAAWLERVVQLCEMLPVRSGVAGFVAEHQGLSEPEMEQIFGAGLRHVGVDLDNNWASALGEPGAIKGVNWLTIIGNPGVERLGGLASLISALDDAALIHRAKHGIVIQAGPVPATGDVNRGDDLPAYRAVYNAVRDLHETMVDAATPFRMGRDDDDVRTVAWLRRFDPASTP